MESKSHVLSLVDFLARPMFSVTGNTQSHRCNVLRPVTPIRGGASVISHKYRFNFLRPVSPLIGGTILTVK